MIDKGLSERRSLQVVGMSPSAFRYQPAADRNIALKARIIALAQRHRRYGAGMIYLKLRQAGEVVNHKRVDRLYAEAGLQVRRRKRKKIPVADRHPLERPLAANQVWSMDFVFDRTAEGRVIKNLTVVDDATHEAVAIVPERALNIFCSLTERSFHVSPACSHSPEPNQKHATARGKVRFLTIPQH